MYRKGADELAAARAELVSYGTRLLDDGLAAGSAGNLSVCNHEAVTYGRHLAQACEPS